MTILLVIVAGLALAFVAFKFIGGMVKFAVIAVLALLCLFVAHQAGAF
jgi:hypothetical protein